MMFWAGFPMQGPSSWWDYNSHPSAMAGKIRALQPQASGGSQLWGREGDLASKESGTRHNRALCNTPQGTGALSPPRVTYGSCLSWNKSSSIAKVWLEVSSLLHSGEKQVISGGCRVGQLPLQPARLRDANPEGGGELCISSSGGGSGAACLP